MHVHSAGSVWFPAPLTPRLLWQTGQYNPISRVISAGRFEVPFRSEAGIAQTQSVCLISPRGVLTPGAMPSIGYRRVPFRVGNDAFRMVELVEQSPAPSTYADQAFDFVWVDFTGDQDADAGISGACSIRVIAGPDVELRTNSGAFRSVTRTGAGDYLLELEAASGFDANESAWIVSTSGQSYPALAFQASVEHLSDTQKRIMVLKEGPPGGSSFLADANVDLLVVDRSAERAAPYGYPERRGCRVFAACLFSGYVPNPQELVANSGQWSSFDNPSPGRYELALHAGAGLIEPDGLFFVGPGEASFPDNQRWFNLTRPTGTPLPTARRVDVYVSQEAIGGGWPTFPDQMWSTIVGVKCGR